MFFSLYQNSYIMMFLSVTMGLSVSSIFSIWFFSEINFFMFLLSLKTYTMKNKNEITLYFFIQAFSSTILMLMCLLNYFFSSWTLSILMILMVKMGLAPFQHWYINMVKELSWLSLWVLSVWMKILYLKMTSFIYNPCFILFSSLNIMLSALFLMKEKMMKPFIALSSLFNMGWVLASLYSKTLWLTYLIFYGANLGLLVSWLKTQNAYYIYPKSNNSFFYEKMIFLLVLLFLVGIPPFAGFFLKMMILLSLIKFSYLISVLMLALSIIFMYFYLMMFFTFLSSSHPVHSFMSSVKSKYFSIFLTLNLCCFTPILILTIYYLNNKFLSLLKPKLKQYMATSVNKMIKD